MMGPVQVLVLGYDEPRFSGEVLAEARRLEDAGIVRLVDVMVVARATTGEFDVVDVDGLPDGQVARQLFDAGDADTAGDGEAPGWSLADAVPAGGAAVVVLLEHIWAQALVDAIGQGGGRPLDEMWLGPADRDLVESLVGRT